MQFLARMNKLVFIPTFVLFKHVESCTLVLTYVCTNSKRLKLCNLMSYKSSPCQRQVVSFMYLFRDIL